MQSEMREFVESVVKRYKANAMPLKEPMVEQQKNLVTIAAWPPGGVAALQHHFTEKQCPVSISIEETPLSIDLHSLPETPFNVNMEMKLKAKDAIPVCMKLCEPVCAKSEYRLDINIFDKQFAGVALRGKTMIFSLKEKPNQGSGKYVI